MAFTTSPNMLLTIPGVGTEQGPNYGLDINTSFTLVDQHDHSLGKGVQITPAGININAALSLNNNNLTNTQGIIFTAQGSLPTTLQYLYVSPGVETPLTEDLWYNDGNGNQVQITNNGLVNATIASIPGESYAAGTFFWKQGALSTVPANFDIGSITLRPNVAATAFGVVLSPPSGITSQYNIALPLLPVSQSLMTIDNLGVISTPGVYPITAASIANNTITAAQIANQTITATQIANQTITATQIANATITNTQIAAGTILQSNLAPRAVSLSAAAGDVAESATSGSFTTTSTSYQQLTGAQTATITIASPAVITVASTTGYFLGMPVKFTTSGALPTGITAGTYYYVAGTINPTTFNISATPGGSLINTTGTQSGTHTATRITFSTTITSTGRPLMIALIPDGTTTEAQVGVVNTGATTSDIMASFKLLRNVTTAVSVVGSSINSHGSSIESLNPPGYVSMLDNPTAGTYTYHFEIKTNTGVATQSAQILNCKMMVYEI